MKKILYFTLAFCLTYITPSFGQIQVFVSNGSGNDSNSGLSWENAKQSIAAGIAAAGNNGTVYVKAGNYNISSQITLSNGVSVKGGYKMISAGTDTTKRNLPNTNSYWTNDVYCTIINGAGNHRIASVGTDCLLEGCVLNNGFTNTMGAGALINGGTVRYCIIKECNAMNDNTFTAEGGGVYMQNGGLLSNSVITLCRGDIGPAVAGGNASLINNTITRNWPTHCGTARDYDGNTYQSVIIGNQCWMRTNLRTTHYNDGTAIVQGGVASTEIPQYYIDYIGIPVVNFPVYGYLYNWAAAMHGNPSSNANPSGVQGICPHGWHLPSHAEWSELYNFVNSRDVYLCNGNGSMAKALCHSIGWSSNSSNCVVGNNVAANNATRFGAVPAGVWTGSFGSYASAAYFWSTTESGANAKQWHFDYNSSAMSSGDYSKSNAISVRCLKDTAPMLPVVTLNSVRITEPTGLCNYSCTNGTSTVTVHGVCWSSSPNPTIDDFHVTDTSSAGIHSITIFGLENDSSYYIRAFAISEQGIAYSNEIGVGIEFCDQTIITDYDGNTYHAVRIGNQCWMKENLRTTHYADGAEITYRSSNSSPDYASYSAPCFNTSKVNTYGYLYSWRAITRNGNGSSSNPSGVQGVCPDGWHMPSSAEWVELYNYVNSQPEYLCNGNAAKALCDSRLWRNNSNVCAPGNNLSTNNATGFSALPAGSVLNSTVYWCDQHARFATVTPVVQNSTHHCVHINEDGNMCVPCTNETGTSNSVRCVRD